MKSFLSLFKNSKIISEITPPLAKKERDNAARKLIDEYIKLSDYGTVTKNDYYDYAGLYKLYSKLISNTSTISTYNSEGYVLTESALMYYEYDLYSGIAYKVSPLGEKFIKEVEQLNNNL